MSRAIKIFITILCASTYLLLAGCAEEILADGPHFSKLAQPKGGYAVVYLWREYHTFGRGVWPEVYFNSTKVVGLLNSGYTYIYLKPGKYHIHCEKNNIVSGLYGQVVDVTVDADKNYFLEFAVVAEEDRNGYVMPIGSTYTFAPPSHSAKRAWVQKTWEDAKIDLPGYNYIRPYVLVVE